MLAANVGATSRVSAPTELFIFRSLSMHDAAYTHICDGTTADDSFTGPLALRVAPRAPDCSSVVGRAARRVFSIHLPVPATVAT